MQNPFYGLNIGNVLAVCKDYDLLRPTQFAEYVQDTLRLLPTDMFSPEEDDKLMKIKDYMISRLMSHVSSLSSDLSADTFCRFFIPYIRGRIDSFEGDVCVDLLNEMQRLMWSDADFNGKQKLEMKQTFETFCHEVDLFKKVGSSTPANILDLFDLVFTSYVKYSLIKRKQNKANKQQRQEFEEHKNQKEGRTTKTGNGSQEKPNPNNEELIVTIKSLTRRDITDSASISQMERCLSKAKQKKPPQENELIELGITLPRGHMAEGICIPYIEWYGSGESGVSEYQSGRNITIAAEREMIDVSDMIPNFYNKYKELEEASVKIGYPKISVDKLRLDSIKAEYDLAGGSAHRLTINFKSIDYFTALILRDYLTQEDNDGKLLPAGRMLYLDTLPRRGEDVPPGLIWPLCGCGVWVITTDNMIIFSRRTTVLELPSNLGYSAAGSCEYTDRLMVRNAYKELGKEANPFITAQRETIEETNIPIDHLLLTNFILVSLGVDIPRCLVQFSFMVHVDLTAKEVLGYYKAGAKSSGEQIISALPMRKDVLMFVLRNFEMEPGAVYSLIHIMEKKGL